MAPAIAVDLQTISISQQVALVLRAGDYVLPLFAAQRETQRVIEAAVAAGRSWLAQRVPDVSALYRDHGAALSEEELKYHDDERRLAAIHACLYMHRFVVWRAAGVALVEEPGVAPSLGNDINEVDESYFYECFEHVVKATGESTETKTWLASITATIFS